MKLCSRLSATLLCGVALTLSLATPAAAEDWPGYLGLHGDGSSKESLGLTSWPKEGPPVLWKSGLGVGFGGAAVVGGRVYLLDRVEDESDVLRCRELDTGKVLWEQSFKRPGRLPYNGSRQVPTVADGRVFAVGPFGHVYCVNAETGQTVWTKDLVGDFQAFRPNFGFAQSPIVYKNTIILAPMSRAVGFVALAADSGEVVWKTPSIGAGGQSSPKLMTIAGVELAVMLNSGGVHAVEAATGKGGFSWKGYRNRNAIPAPTDCGGGRFFFTGGYRGGSAMAKITRGADGQFVFKTLFQLPEGSQIPPAIKIGDHLFANFNENRNLRNPPGLVCLGLDGKEKWRTQKSPGIERGGLIVVDGKLLVLGGNDGILRLIEPTGEGYKELAKAAIFEGLRRRGNNIWAPMAFSNGRLVLRSQTELKCLDLRKGAKAAPKKRKEFFSRTSEGS